MRARPGRRPRRRVTEAEVLGLQVLELDLDRLAVGSVAVVDRGASAERVGELRAALAVLVEGPRERRQVLRRRHQLTHLLLQPRGSLEHQLRGLGAAAGERVEAVDEIGGERDHPLQLHQRGGEIVADRDQLVERRDQQVGEVRGALERPPGLVQHRREPAGEFGELLLAGGGDGERLAAGGDGVAELDPTVAERRQNGVEVADELGEQAAAAREGAGDRGRGLGELADLAQRRAELVLGPLEAAMGLGDHDLGVGAGVGVEDPGELVDRNKGGGAARVDAFALLERPASHRARVDVDDQVLDRARGAHLRGRVGEDLAADVGIEGQRRNRLAGLVANVGDPAEDRAGDRRPGLVDAVEALGVGERDLDLIRGLREGQQDPLLVERVGEEDDRRKQLDRDHESPQRDLVDVAGRVDEPPQGAADGGGEAGDAPQDLHDSGLNSGRAPLRAVALRVTGTTPLPRAPPPAPRRGRG